MLFYLGLGEIYRKSDSALTGLAVAGVEGEGLEVQSQGKCEENQVHVLIAAQVVSSWGSWKAVSQERPGAVSLLSQGHPA